ncbi:MAG: SAM-dependent chlorinase/fluorinase [Candidatus Nitrohelix vancouverensis]|uniref:SAM-dependent chlorinase/fluorinase n=1 Tax=Candidatus Nitrohelix vancouverensis TaxID=2705534 RepID=A0A7T0C4G4_9BACT|nr:MAG: SAM-dependent chlorinase/fluorinase [Candidatus Nitrohelix vancouverensis]
MPPIVTLTSDFGLRDPFAGILKGVIWNIAPKARIVDLTHEIEPQNIRQAALTLESAAPYFPKGTIHLAVVDPGVGSERRAMAVDCGDCYFVGPDNGLASALLTPRSKCYELNKKKYFLSPLSATFHGRDVFAPIAAWLAKGTPISQLGRKITDAQRLSFPGPERKGDTLKGEILHVDRFGNLSSNIKADDLIPLKKKQSKLRIRISRKSIAGLVENYTQVAAEQYGALINSWNRLEIFCNQENAAERLKAGIGSAITISQEVKSQ